MSISTHESLFLRAYTPHDLFEGEKRASLVKMPDDEKKWPPFILSSLQREFPFLAEYETEIVLDRIEPEAGAALGYVQVRNRTRAKPQDVGAFGNVIRIPIIIQDRRLQKFLVFETGGQTYPLTEERVKQAMIDPGVFDTPAGKVPSSPSIVDQLFPPYQQRQGFGRVVEPSAMGLSKLSSADEDKRPSVPKGVAAGAGIGGVGGAATGTALSQFIQRTDVGRKAMQEVGQEMGMGVGAVRKAVRAAPLVGAARGVAAGALIGGGVAAYKQRKDSTKTSSASSPVRVKLAKIMGERKPDANYMSSGGAPTQHKLLTLRRYLRRKGGESPSSHGAAMGGGALMGVALGGLAGMGRGGRGAAIGATVGAGLGAALGALLRVLDKHEIQRVQAILKGGSKAERNELLRMLREAHREVEQGRRTEQHLRDSRREMRADSRHREMIREMRRR